MAYEQLEEIRSRKHEKVALFLTAQNMAGLIIVALPIYIATHQLSSVVLRTVLLILAATLGVSVTLDVAGLPLYERLLWRLRGAIRRRTGDGVVAPATFSGAPLNQGDRAVPLHGPIRIVHSDDVRSGSEGSAIRWTGAPAYRYAGHLDLPMLAEPDAPAEHTGTGRDTDEHGAAAPPEPVATPAQPVIAGSPGGSIQAGASPHREPWGINADLPTAQHAVTADSVPQLVPTAASATAADRDEEHGAGHAPLAAGVAAPGASVPSNRVEQPAHDVRPVWRFALAVAPVASEVLNVDQDGIHADI
jgi:hypothetical protein